MSSYEGRDNHLEHAGTETSNGLESDPSWAIERGTSGRSLGSSQGLRNEIAANKRCSMKQLHRLSRLHCLLTSKSRDVLRSYRNHECHKRRSRATSFDEHISLRNPWAPHPIYRPVPIPAGRLPGGTARSAHGNCAAVVGASAHGPASSVT
jgi:hypothetical protein